MAIAPFVVDATATTVSRSLERLLARSARRPHRSMPVDIDAACSVQILSFFEVGAEDNVGSRDALAHLVCELASRLEIIELVLR